MFRLGCHLVGGELTDEVVAPCAMVLRVVDDGAALLAVVNDDMEDVGPGLTLVNAFDPVALELSLQRLEQIDLGTLAKAH